MLISPELLFFAVLVAADEEAVLTSEEYSGADGTSLMEIVETAPLEVNLITTVTHDRGNKSEADNVQGDIRSG